MPPSKNRPDRPACGQAACFTVFQLPRPTPERPYVKGLLDPCTNSLAAPNIPAEVLYDKQARPSLIQTIGRDPHRTRELGARRASTPSSTCMPVDLADVKLLCFCKGRARRQNTPCIHASQPSLRCIAREMQWTPLLRAGRVRR